jgi:hypothetical protein
VDLILERKRLEEVVAPIIQQVVKQCRQTMAITSFSATDANSFLWEEYGGNGNGACIAINIPDRLIGNTYHRVQYVSERVFHIDRFLEAVLCHNKAFEVYRNILLTKTKKWSQEEEIRFVSNRPDVNWLFDGHITEVTFGWHVPAPILEQLTAKIGDHCHSRNIIIATINHPTLDCAGMPLQVDSW